ncbi:cancer/testis antigen 55-like, partial [Tupaia chinensis]|uniref:cancer/testis antigen 55-like n=1 Tax=Tupaia chinensis TaxID=246437 RepID=UPI0003C8CC43
MLRLLRRALAFFQRRADPAQEQHSQQAELQQADIQLRSIQGIVTNLCGDYGLINEWIYFTSDIVADNMPLKVGQKVVALMEGSEIFQELKAIK